MFFSYSMHILPCIFFCMLGMALLWWLMTAVVCERALAASENVKWMPLCSHRHAQWPAGFVFREPLLWYWWAKSSYLPRSLRLLMLVWDSNNTISAWSFYLTFCGCGWSHINTLNIALPQNNSCFSGKSHHDTVDLYLITAVVIIITVLCLLQDSYSYYAHTELLFNF